jgi:hypothetical protein
VDVVGQKMWWGQAAVSLALRVHGMCYNSSCKRRLVVVDVVGQKMW